MAFARPRKEMTELPDNGGVIVHIAWFKEDPGDDWEAQPDFNGQQIIHVQSIDDVTPEMIEEAIAKDLPTAEAVLNKREPARVDARASLGRVYNGSSVAAEVALRQKQKKGLADG